MRKRFFSTGFAVTIVACSGSAEPPVEGNAAAASASQSHSNTVQVKLVCDGECPRDVRPITGFILNPKSSAVLTSTSAIYQLYEDVLPYRDRVRGYRIIFAAPQEAQHTVAIEVTSSGGFDVRNGNFNFFGAETAALRPPYRMAGALREGDQLDLAVFPTGSTVFGAFPL